MKAVIAQTEKKKQKRRFITVMMCTTIILLIIPRTYHHGSSEKGFSLIAHRGDSRSAPENTLPAFRLALQEHVDMVELDSRVTADDVLVIIHDATLDRTTDARVRWNSHSIQLSQKKYDDIRTLDAGSWFNKRFKGTAVPTLVEAMLEISDGGRALIHRKTGDPRMYAAELFRYSLVHKAIVQADDLIFLQDLHMIAPTIPLGYVGDSAAIRRIGLMTLKKSGITVLAIDITGLDRDLLFEAMSDRFTIFIYTVDKIGLGIQIASFGVDGIITDNIVHMRAALRKSGVQ
ncbi:MAG TPA: glycerophosphodiester phosphodiesterase family protein [Spirochaetota bacterium]